MRLAFAILVAAGLLLSSPSYAQIPDQRSSPAAPDIGLLNKAITQLLADKTLVTTSEMQMSATGQGMTFVFRERLHVVTQKPGRYHSDVTLLATDGTPGTKYTVISDGVKVWVYQPGAHLYSVVPRSSYADNDISGLGLFGSLLSSTTGSVNGRLDLNSLAQDGWTVQDGTQAAGGGNYQAFAMADPKLGYKFRLLIDPQTTTLHQLGLDGQEKQIDFSVTETITRQSPSPPLPNSLFYFTPPAGARRVPNIAIGPF